VSSRLVYLIYFGAEKAHYYYVGRSQTPVDIESTTGINGQSPNVLQKQDAEDFSPLHGPVDGILVA